MCGKWHPIPYGWVLVNSSALNREFGSQTLSLPAHPGGSVAWPNGGTRRSVYLKASSDTHSPRASLSYVELGTLLDLTWTLGEQNGPHLNPRGTEWTSPGP